MSRVTKCTEFRTSCSFEMAESKKTILKLIKFTAHLYFQSHSNPIRGDYKFDIVKKNRKYLVEVQK